VAAVTSPDTEDGTGTAEAIRSGRTTATEAVAESLQRIHDLDGDLNAFTVTFADEARAAAAAADRQVAAGGPLPPLLGVPVSIKDHIWMADAPATNGSVALQHFAPAEDCTAVARLRDAGAIIVGKTNNPEFCYRGYTDNNLYGLTRNPWDRTRTPGGSSGGAAAGVSAGMTALALGTDGGGSIRIPASFCGVAGHKPTFGLVPKEPGFKGWKSLSVHGPITRSVRDCALMLEVMAGPAATDDTTGPLGFSLAAVGEQPDLTGLRVAYSADLSILPVDNDVRRVFAEAVKWFEQLGCVMVSDHPDAEGTEALWNTIALTEGYASEGPLLAEFGDQMSPGIAELVAAGRDTTGAQYVDALHDKARYTRRWAEFFTGYDLLLLPSSQLTAFSVDLLTPTEIEGRPIDPFFDDWCAVYLPANLTGMPATSVPAGFGDGGLPVGVQVMGPRWSDALTLRAAAAFEQVVPWTGFRPPPPGRRSKDDRA
jgi:Asp-tRNA(Asn)/Glu-tRNA(Gln) amidotransferase A subunit family amidase